MTEQPGIPGSDPGGPIPAPRRSLAERLARFLFWPLHIVMLLVVIVFYVAFVPVSVDGDSMEPQLSDGDRVLATKSYDELRNGDVVIIDPPSGEGSLLVKRIAALPGDTIYITDDVAVVNGVVEAERGVVRVAGLGLNVSPLVVPEGAVYVLGDNRPVSWDSRVAGPLSVDRISGRVAFIFWPPERIRPVR